MGNATPDKKFWAAEAMTSTFTQVFKIYHRSNIAFQLEAAIGTHVGTISFEGRIEGANNWHAIISPITVAAAATVDILAEFTDLVCDEVRVSYNFTGGTGALNGWWTQKVGR